MSNTLDGLTNRRLLVKGAVGAAGLAMLFPLHAKPRKLRVGMMLPYTGTFSQIGNAITHGFKLAVQERGSKLSGMELEYITVDDESNPAKASENANRLTGRDKVDVVIGTVHSGVAMGMTRVMRDSGVLWINPAAGTNEATGSLCAPNIFRTSFSNWQINYPLGKVLKEKGHKTAVFITWRYAAGEQMLAGFKEGFNREGGVIQKEFFVPFPQVEFQALLTEIAAIKPDAVVAFFAGAGAAKFLNDYRAAGLSDKIPLYGSGLLTEGILDAVNGAAEGVETTLHYGDGLDIPKDRLFRANYLKMVGVAPDVYSVQGYDAGQLLAAGVAGAMGDLGNRPAIIKAMESARIDSPRGVWTLSKAHNPIQDSYLRKVVGRENRVIGIAAKALADPAIGCQMI